MAIITQNGAVLVTAAAVPTTGVVWQNGCAFNAATGALYVAGGIPAVLAQSAIPFILAGGTGGGGLNQITTSAAGALSTIATLPTTYAGAWFYLPANTYDSNTAGWYWFVGSSTTAGTVYNNRYTSGDPRLAVPTSLTPFVTAGAGFVSQTTASSITAHQITVPGGSIGPNGAIRTQILSYWRAITSANQLAMSFGGNEYFGNNQAVNDPNVGVYGVLISIYNINSASRQTVSAYAGDLVIASTGVPTYFSVNTANDFVMNTRLTLNNASAYSLIQAVRYEVMYGA